MKDSRTRNFLLWLLDRIADGIGITIFLPCFLVLMCFWLFMIAFNKWVKQDVEPKGPR